MVEYEPFIETENRSRSPENVLDPDATWNQLFQLLVTSFKYSYPNLVVMLQ